jgi:hypothetical protein
VLISGLFQEPEATRLGERDSSLPDRSPSQKKETNPVLPLGSGGSGLAFKTNNELEEMYFHSSTGNPDSLA